MKNFYKRRTKTILIAVIVLCLAVPAGIQVSIDRGKTSRTNWRDVPAVEGASSFADIFGGVRQFLAAYLWNKGDTVYHEYYGANVYKEIALYPYYWMITRLDKHFATPFYFASWMLCRFGLTDEGFNLAIEGLKHNPNSPELHENLASIYYFFKKNPKKARYHVVRAINLTSDPEERQVLMNFLSLVEETLAGKKKIPELTPVSEAEKKHEHEEGEYCPECGHEH